jgi:hypothetical protein
LLTFVTYITQKPLKTVNKLILCLFMLAFTVAKVNGQVKPPALNFDFYGNPITIEFDRTAAPVFTGSLCEEAVINFNNQLNNSRLTAVAHTLLSFKEQYQLDDWVYYQLVRKTTQLLSPKANNYHQYTLYKWFLLTRSGYDASLSFKGDTLLFYVQSDENIYNIPIRTRDGKQYVCLNYHDYGGHIDFEKNRFTEVVIPVEAAKNSFSYKVTRLPGFNLAGYTEKDLHFKYNENEYHFKVKLNPQVKTMFANYPVVDYESYFNIPLSNETYRSLIPVMRGNLKKMSIKEGINYLMRFTRYAFLYRSDTEVFGDEKRLTPEQTLLFDQSDCEDRAALFFYLVKEIYNLPMIVLAYPEHVTIAVNLGKSKGTPVVYNGLKYYVCEPTPQKQDLRVGELPGNLKHTPYEVVYAYTPQPH